MKSILSFSLRLPLVCFIFLLGFACSSESEPEPEIIADLTQINIDETSPGYLLAQQLSLGMKHADVRSFIKKKANEKFDGDFNFLYSQAKYEPIGGAASRSLSFQEVLFGKEASSASKISDLFEGHPLLQIAMPEIPGLGKEWDTKNYQPLVVLRPPGVDLNVAENLPAFDRDGNQIEFNHHELPSEPIIVVSYNERLIGFDKAYVNKIKNQAGARTELCIADSDPYMATDTEYYFLAEDVYCGGGGGGGTTGGGGGTGGTTTCDRDSKNTKDHIQKVKFADIDHFRKAEHYLDGNPEVFVIVTFGAKDPAGFSNFRKYIASADRSHWKDCGLFSCKPEWYGTNRVGMPLPMMDWDEPFYGDRVRYDWWEYDPDNKQIKISVNLSVKFKDGISSTGTAEYTVSAKDYNLGHDVVKYCDNTDGEGTYYTTGFLHWYVNQQ